MTTDSHAREKQALQEESAAKQARIAAEERAQADRIPAALERIAEALEGYCPKCGAPRAAQILCRAARRNRGEGR